MQSTVAKSLLYTIAFFLFIVLLCDLIRSGINSDEHGLSVQRTQTIVNYSVENRKMKYLRKKNYFGSFVLRHTQKQHVHRTSCWPAALLMSHFIKISWINISNQIEEKHVRFYRCLYGFSCCCRWNVMWSSVSWKRCKLYVQRCKNEWREA